MKYVFGLLLAGAPHARAGVMFRTSAMYTSATVAGLEGSRTLVDVNPGYVRDKGWFFGGTYQMDTAKSGAASVATTSLGPSVGAFSRKEFGWYGVATYFVTSKRGEADQSYDGRGYQADVGYRFSVHHMSYALQMSYKHFSYENKQSKTSLEVSRIDPYFSVWYEY